MIGRLERNALRLKFTDDVGKVGDRARKPINLRHRQHVAGAKERENRLKFRPAFGRRSAHFLTADHVATGSFERRKLDVQVLRFRCAVCTLRVAIAARGAAVSICARAGGCRAGGSCSLAL